MSENQIVKSPIPVRLGTLRIGTPVTFDLFIKVGDRFLHYLRTQDEIDAELLGNLKRKGVKKLFIDETSEPQYLSYLESGLNQLGADSSLSKDEKAALAKDSLTSDSENALKNIATEQGYRSTENRVQKVVDFLLSDKGAVNAILSTSGVSSDAFVHSANVATMSLGLASLLGLTSSQSQTELGLAALLHDMEKLPSALKPLNATSNFPQIDKKNLRNTPKLRSTLSPPSLMSRNQSLL